MSSIEIQNGNKTIIIEVTKTEQRFLELLLTYPHSTFTYEEIWTEIWGYVPFMRSWAMSQIAAQCRKKLKTVGIEAIFAQYKIGYRFYK